jgi:hypothetical protein
VIYYRFIYHFTEIRARRAFHYDDVLIELVAFLAILSGAFMLRGHNWARWLALTWIAFHVILSAFHALGEFTMHALFCAAISWFLFRPDAKRYFRGAQIEAT